MTTYSSDEEDLFPSKPRKLKGNFRVPFLLDKTCVGGTPVPPPVKNYYFTNDSTTNAYYTDDALQNRYSTTIGD